jgi:hypothetical protein
MKQRLNKDYGSYGQRWQAETGFSMLKRRIAEEIHARHYWSQARELWLLAITYNLMLLYAAVGFLQSRSGTICRNGPKGASHKWCLTCSVENPESLVSC